MGGSNSKNSIFDEHPKNYKNIPYYCHQEVTETNNWKLKLDETGKFFCFLIERPFPKYRRYEVVYQFIVVNKNHLSERRVFRRITTLVKRNFYSVSSHNIIYKFRYEPKYNQFDFQVVAYAVIEKNGLRKLNFEDKNVYGESMKVLTTGGSLEVPVQFIYLRAPLLTKYIDEKKPDPKFESCSEEFFQVFHGVHVQLEVEEIRSLLKLSVEFQVLNVKKYCEQQLIRRDDLDFSEEQKFEFACKYNLNILMNQVLRNVKSVGELAKLTSIAIEMESMDTNISKLLIAKMYKIS
ncbi:unnamed protein product [Caenorhabditis brenneri]